MKSVQLAQFLSQVSVWPKTQSEMDSLAEKLLDLLESLFVAFFSSHHHDREIVGVSISPFLNAKNFNRDIFASFLKKQLKQIGSDTNQIKQIQLANTGSNWPISSSVQNLTYTRLMELNPRSRKDVGSLVVGTAKPLGMKEELLFISASQRLADLARIDELEIDLQVRNQFLSIASHELKTPLTSIYGILQLQERMLRMKKDQTSFPDQEQHHNFLKMVIRQTERLNELIDGLLDVSRIQNGRFMVEPSETDIATLLKDCTNSRLDVIAKEGGAQLQVDAPDHLVAWVDPVRMEEVIINLVMNAIRFSPEGGVVWIRLRRVEDSFRLTVRDQGPSIPLEDRERIFQPFERAQRTGRMGGLGLGLFISRQIAQLHGGNVDLIESVLGKGNVFEAFFPMRNANLATA